jgi:hypothetical protein
MLGSVIKVGEGDTIGQAPCVIFDLTFEALLLI